MTTLFLSVFASLFSVSNPLGTMPIFIGLTQNLNKKQQNRIALRTSLFMTLILIISFFLGSYIMKFFSISIPSLRIAGGLIIASSGFALLTGTFAKHKGMDKRVKDDAFQKEDPSLTPLAIPMLAGPGSISLLITMHQAHNQISHIFMICGVILLIGIITWIILRTSHGLIKKLGASGLNAISRIIGFIVIAIGVEYIIQAILAISKQILT